MKEYRSRCNVNVQDKSTTKPAIPREKYKQRNIKSELGLCHHPFQEACLGKRTLPKFCRTCFLTAVPKRNFRQAHKSKFGLRILPLKANMEKRGHDEVSCHQLITFTRLVTMWHVILLFCEQTVIHYSSRPGSADRAVHVTTAAAPVHSGLLCDLLWWFWKSNESCLEWFRSSQHSDE